MSSPDPATRGGGDYQTPATARRSWWDVLGRPGNLYFYAGLFAPVIKCSREYRRGEASYHKMINHAEAALQIVERCGGKVQIEGTQWLDTSPKVYVANHMSSLETIMLTGVMERAGPVTFVVKESLLKYPYMGDVLRLLKSIPVSRVNAVQDLKIILKDGVEMLKSGTSVIVFPQHTRGEAFNPDDFNTIGIKLARRAGVPVQAFALETSFCGKGRLFSDYGPVRRDRPVRYRFAPPSPTITAENEKQVHQECVQFIAATLKEWRSPAS